MHGTACKKHRLNLDAFLFAEILQTMTSALPVMKMFLNTVSLFFNDQADEKESLDSFAKACAQLCAGAAE